MRSAAMATGLPLEMSWPRISAGDSALAPIGRLPRRAFARWLATVSRSSPSDWPWMLQRAASCWFSRVAPSRRATSGMTFQTSIGA